MNFAPGVEQRAPLRESRFSIEIQPNEILEIHTAWRKKVEEALEDNRRLEIARKEHRPLRLRALGQIMLVELDKKVGFSASQRERLLPIAESLERVPAFFPEDLLDRRDATFAPSAFFLAGANAPWKEMMAILDAAQWKRWKKACDPKTIEEEGWRGSPMRTEPEDDGERPRIPPEPEVLEAAVSDFLHRETAPARKRIFSEMILRVEDVARLAGLGPESVSRLRMAAKGATEKSLARWKAMVDPIAHEEMGDASPASVIQRLFSVRRFIFERNPDILPENQPVWTRTLLDELTDAQRAKLQKELSERSDFKTSSIAALILAEFDREIPISAEQREKLEPLVTEFQDKYASQIEMYLDPQWYLRSYAMFSPIARIPDTDLSAILSKQQFDHWKDTSERSSSAVFWENIQQVYAKRMNEKE